MASRRAVWPARRDAENMCYPELISFAVRPSG